MITEFLSLLYLDEDGESGPDPAKTDTKVIFVATFSCLCLFLLFIAIFFIYRCAEREPAIPDFPSRELQVYPNWKEYLNRLKNPSE
ncbi:V-set and transmembrane domain-containing protein 1 isoform X4 [Kogia breviceps]|uniref:V-set and transmembrane domain-containing protein 1 isoform X4 n=1 Tax=Kogia breviceps TaxID=27615 RepID=UPI0034D1EED2